VALRWVCSKAKGTYSAIRLCRAIADPISSPPEQLQARSLGTANDINKGECVSLMCLHSLLMIERRMLVRTGKKTLPSGDEKGKSRAERVWVENQGHVEARRVPSCPFSSSQWHKKRHSIFRYTRTTRLLLVSISLQDLVR
jgi:hypothetical protein